MGEATGTELVDRRYSPRAPMQMLVSVRQRGEHKLPATLVDISPFGCNVVGISGLTLQEEVWIRIPGLESQLTRVNWTTPNTAGLSFINPLHPAVVNQLCNSRSDSLYLAQRSSGGYGQARCESTGKSESRRDQIIRGITFQTSLLRRKSRENASGSLSAMIKRNSARLVDHRREPRYPAPQDAGMVVDIDSHRVDIENLSSSGLKVSTTLPNGIGAIVSVGFEGCDDIIGRVVWKRDGTTGIDLPADAIVLNEN